MGIILDLQQLFTATKQKFEKEFLRIPKDSLHGLHIHTKHQPPKEDDIIPWHFVSNEIQDMIKHRPLYNTTRSFHSYHVEETYDFSKSFMKL